MVSPYNYITSTGVIVPDTSELQAAVEAEWKDALGQDTVVTPDTLQGTIISGEVTARISVVNNNAKLANQINPNESGGIFADAICALLGLDRDGATRTVTTGVTIAGQPQTPVPQGSQARTEAGDLFRTMMAVTFNSLGVATVDFEAVETGPVSCPAGALNQVVDMVLGWETVTNPTAGIIGMNEQSDTSLLALRRNTLAKQGISVSEAVTSDVYDVDGVRSLSFRENIAATTQTIDGIVMVAHSVYLCVDGGTDADIALALLTNKTVGGNWNGTTTVNVVDASSGQSYPVKFSRPIVTSIYARVTVKRGKDVSDPLVSVPLAIYNYSIGLIPNDAGLTVGHDASPFEFAAAVNYYHPEMLVTKVELSTDNATWSTNNIPIGLDHKGATQLSFIQVIIV